jgi:hypothetical protein
MPPTQQQLQQHVIDSVQNYSDNYLSKWARCFTTREWGEEIGVDDRDEDRAENVFQRVSVSVQQESMRYKSYGQTKKSIATAAIEASVVKLTLSAPYSDIKYSKFKEHLLKMIEPYPLLNRPTFGFAG